MQAVNSQLYRTFNSYTIFIEADNFTAKNITFENSAGTVEIVGQGVAVYVEEDIAKLKNCRLLGNQDTLFTGPLPPKPIEGNNFGDPMDRKERIVGRQCLLRKTLARLCKNCIYKLLYG